MEFIDLRKVLSNIKEYNWSDALYLPEDETWDLETKAAIIDPDDVEDDSDEVPLFAKQNDLMYALDIQTIKGIINNALMQKNDCTHSDLLEAFLYYYDNDAFIVINKHHK